MEIHIFDIDHTLIKQSTTHCFIKTSLKRKLVSIPQLLLFPWKCVLYKMNMIEPEFIEHEAQKYKGIPKKLLKEISVESFRNYGRKTLYTEAVSLLKNLKAKGHRVIAATSSLDLFIEPFMEFLEIDEWIATSLEFSEGNTTGKTEGHSVFGKNKLYAVEEYFKKNNLSLDEAVFYSDSYSDFPLLAACKKAIPVNPDRKLKKEALRQGWECLKFSKTLGN